MAMWMALLGICGADAQAGEIVWAGLDYGHVQMVGTMDFRDPGEIFPGYLEKWNALLLAEQVDDLEKRLKVDVRTTLDHLQTIHAQADPETQIVRIDSRTTDEHALTPSVVAQHVAQYSIEGEGLGLVFIADQLNKPEQKGCYWVTFFDLQSKAVRSTEHRCGKARGFGFRNYWFGTVKGVIAGLRKSDLPGAR
ncbi:MAG: hypothetical protein KTR31_04375 [Myxococcales bacterium]|nr:hypothetical protein [Myxococcales bacterium]